MRSEGMMPYIVVELYSVSKENAISGFRVED
jgi:hypothetical protein